MPLGGPVPEGLGRNGVSLLEVLCWFVNSISISIHLCTCPIGVCGEYIYGHLAKKVIMSSYVIFSIMVGIHIFQQWGRNFEWYKCFSQYEVIKKILI